MTGATQLRFAADAAIAVARPAQLKPGGRNGVFVTGSAGMEWVHEAIMLRLRAQAVGFGLVMPLCLDVACPYVLSSVAPILQDRQQRTSPR